LRCSVVKFNIYNAGPWHTCKYNAGMCSLTCWMRWFNSLAQIQ